MKITASWDSGPYGIYYRAGQHSDPREIVEVPDGVFERYEKAEEELTSAQDALDDAIAAASK